MKIALAALLALTPVSVLADEYQAGYSSSKTCFREEYREEYVPGTYSSLYSSLKQVLLEE